MSKKQAKTVTVSYAKKEFAGVGITIILYSLLMLYIPKALKLLLEETDSFIIHDRFLFYGIYYILMVIGTILPFSLLKYYCNISVRNIRNKTHLSFTTLIMNTMVYFSIASLLIFFTMMILNRFKISGSLASDIAVSIDAKSMDNWLYLLMFVILSPFLEEYAFRGILLKTLDRYGKRFGIIATSIIYALAHHSFIDMIPAFFMSSMLCLIVESYKSLQPTVFIHMLFNLFLVVLIKTPASYANYMTYCLTALYLLSFLFVIKRGSKAIILMPSDNGNVAFGLFFSSFPVILACIVLIIHSVLAIFI
ncbi:MAG: CPBP family intramembrane metalloprotease [Erysipelotrichaceae bacterium]|nr:CPBP family intramembrane metalloprotease [Erysipelotrichaceae bacterium]